MTRFPWWVSVLMAIIGYLGLKYGSGYLLAPGHRLSGLLPQFAPVVAMGFLLLAAKQLYDNDPNADTDENTEQDDSPKKAGDDGADE